MGKSTFSSHVEVEVHVIIYLLRTRGDIQGCCWNPVALDDLTWTLRQLVPIWSLAVYCVDRRSNHHESMDWEMQILHDWQRFQSLPCYIRRGPRWWTCNRTRDRGSTSVLAI